MANTPDALKPEYWSNLIQVPLYKSLVAMNVATTRLEADLKDGDTVHLPYYSTLSAQTYTPQTDFTTIDWSTTDEYLVADQFKVVPWYVDDITKLQSHYDIQGRMAQDAAFRLKDLIDQDVLGEYANAATTMDDGDLGGTAGSGISATTSNIFQIFSTARKILREQNVEEAGDFFAVVSPATAEIVERQAAGAGFSVADSTLRNGFAGHYDGFSIYVSNNLTNASYGGKACDHHLFGKKGSIDVVVQKAPSMQIKDVPTKLGKNFVASLVYGLKTFNKNSSRFLDVPIRTA